MTSSVRNSNGSAPNIVAMRLNAYTASGDTSLVNGFKDPLRKDAEDWLAMKGQEEAQHSAKTLRLARQASDDQNATLRWAKIAGRAALVAALLAIVPLVQWLLGK